MTPSKHKQYDLLMTLNFEVIRRDRNGHKTFHNESIFLPALIKHMALAGMDMAPTVDKLIAMPATLLTNWRRIYDGNLRNGVFGDIPHSYREPDEQRRFSRLIGRATVDYLLKKYDRVSVTQNYESVMDALNIPIAGVRGDLIGFTNSNIIAVAEAKGRTGTVSDNQMNALKAQAANWPIRANTTIIGIAQNIYSGLVVKYYDPEFPSTKLSSNEFQRVMRSYYDPVEEFMSYFDFSKQIKSEKTLYRIPLWGLNEIEGFNYHVTRTFSRLKIELLISKSILHNHLPPTVDDLHSSNSKYLYMDKDGIGIKIS